MIQSGKMAGMADHPHTIDRWDDATGENLIEQIAGVTDCQNSEFRIMTWLTQRPSRPKRISGLRVQTAARAPRAAMRPPHRQEP